MPLKNKRRRHHKSAHEPEQKKALNALNRKAISIRSKQRRKKAWDDMLEWMKRSKDLLKKSYGRTCTHEEHKTILLVFMHNIKLFLGEALEEGDNYFLKLTWNNCFLYSPPRDFFSPYI